MLTPDPQRQAIRNEIIDKVGCGYLMFMLVVGPALPILIYVGAKSIWGENAAIAAGSAAFVVFVLYIAFVARPRLNRLFQPKE